jgi:superfamily II DNA or RNA helicase
MAEFTITNIIKINQWPEGFERIFTHSNPKFYENERLGFSNFSVPREIELFRKNGKSVSFPRGLVKEVAGLGSFEFKDQTVTNPIDFPPSKILLKDYQIPAVEQMLKKNQGLLVAPPGSGKTICGIETILKHRQKSLVLTHSKALCQQWRDRFKQFTGIEPGVINSGQFLVSDLTVAMVQSLNRPLEKTFTDQFGLVLLDEAHHAPAYTFQKLIEQFPAKHRYGLTATPERADGLFFVLKAVMGNIIYEIKREGLYRSDEIIKPRIKVIETNFFNNEIQDYTGLLASLIINAERNVLIIKKVLKEAETGHFCLVLSNRIDHASWLHQSISLVSKVRSACLTSKTPKNERYEIFKETNEGRIPILCATQLADEGLDIPRLDRLFLTCPIRSKNKVTQQIGRIQRKFPGKKDAIVFDFRDSLCGLTESQFQTRLKTVYTDYEVEEIAYNGNQD